MYRVETFSRDGICNEASKIAEEGEATTTFPEIMTLYVNSKPGTWKLISHAVENGLHIFIWATGE